MQSLSKKTMGLTEWVLLIFLSLLWGGSFFFGMVALGELRPFTIVLGRVGIAAAALNLVVVATGQRMPSSIKLWGAFLIMGALNNLIPFSLIFWGETRISSGLASILNATTPLWTILLAHLFTRDERLSVYKVGGVLLGLIGVAIMVGGDLFQGQGANVVAQLAVVGATVSYAFAGIFGKRFKGISPLVTAAGQVTCTAILAAPIALIVDRPWNLPAPHAKTIAAILGIALLSTAVAYIIYFRLLSSAGASNVLLVTFLIPVSALILSIVVLHEKIEVGQFVGMGLIGCGLAFIDGRILQKLRLSFQQASSRSKLDGGPN
jgi:drug/metabolite transporter (DMT)-like permease